MSDILVTPRLFLRRWLPSDLPLFALMNADPEVMEFYPALLNVQESADFIARIEKKFEQNGFGLWALEIRDTGVFAGYTGLNIPDFTASFTPCIEIGWRLAHAQWGKGYASEAARMVLAWAFEQKRLPQILSWTFSSFQVLPY